MRRDLKQRIIFECVWFGVLFGVAFVMSVADPDMTNTPPDVVAIGCVVWSLVGAFGWDSLRSSRIQNDSKNHS